LGVKTHSKRNAKIISDLIVCVQKQPEFLQFSDFLFNINRSTFVATPDAFSKLYIKMRLRRRFCPGPRCEILQRPPDLLAGF